MYFFVQFFTGGNDVPGQRRTLSRESLGWMVQRSCRRIPHVQGLARRLLWRSVSFLDVMYQLTFATLLYDLYRKTPQFLVYWSHPKSKPRFSSLAKTLFKQTECGTPTGRASSLQEILTWQVFIYINQAASNSLAGYFGCSCQMEVQNLAKKLCAAKPERTVLENQHLFNVYIHPMPSFGSEPPYVNHSPICIEKSEILTVQEREVGADFKFRHSITGGWHCIDPRLFAKWFNRLCKAP